MMKTQTPTAQFSGPALATWKLALAGAACIVALAAALGAWFAAPQAYADNINLDAPVTVSDDITRLNVNKLDADTHDYVVGATMAIINEETSEVVDSWVTGKEAYENEKTLNVGVVYILREISAPEGYEKIPDVRFRVKETEGEGIEILSGGDDVELTEAYKLAVYDKAIPAEEVTTVTKSKSTSEEEKSKNNTTKVVAPKTGDETPLSLVAALMGLGVSLILILQLVKRRLND